MCAISVSAKPHASNGQDFTTGASENLRAQLRGGTGFDRLRRMYSFDELGQPSPELRYIIKGGYLSACMGALLGGISSLHKAKEDFMRRNVATPFESEHLARRKLTDTMSLAAIKGASKYALKLGSFTSVYLAITMSAANYNNRSTIFEHITAGAFFGSMMKVNYGLKGMTAASILGAFLGLLAGSVILTSMKISGINFEDFRLWQHEYYSIKLRTKGKEGDFSDVNI